MSCLDKTALCFLLGLMMAVADGLPTHAATNSPALQLLDSARPLVIGHRGYSAVAPENTLPSFERAIAAGADLVELDYHHSHDGVPVVLHDSTLDRTTDATNRWGGKGLKVSDRTLAELRGLQAGQWFHPSFPAVSLPMLSEALDVIQRGSVTLIERKAGDAATCVKLLRERDLINRVIVQAFQRKSDIFDLKLQTGIATSRIMISTPFRFANFASRCFAPRVVPALVASMIAISGADAATQGNWPQYRGSQASGLSAGAATPIRWNLETGENILWQTNVPGLSHASPIVWGDRVYLATATRPGKADLKVGLYGDIASANDQAPHEWRLLAFDKHSGKLVWNELAHSGIPRVKRHTKASHCNSTPATNGRRIVAILGSEGLFCFDMEGRRQWHADLGPMDSGYFRSPSAQWGFASSPVIHDGKVVVLCDVQTNSFLAVFNLEDGREIWRMAREDVPTWSTPTMVRADDQTQILINGWRHSGAYDFATGREVWKLDGGGDIPVPTPIIGHGFAYLTSAHGRSRPMRAIRLEATGDITPSDIGATNAAIAWVQPRQGNYMQTPIVVGDHLYGCYDNGVLTCFDAKTGAIRYSERLGPGAEGFTASPVSEGRHIYIPSEVGNVYVVPATGKFSVVATNVLGETCMATPAISDGTLFFRTRERLIGVGAR